MNLRCNLTSLLCLLFALMPFATLAQWQKTSGPPGSSIEVFYSDGANLFAGTATDGAFISTDNGMTWSAANKELTGITVLSFVRDDKYLYAGTDHGVYRSQNNGATWKAENAGIETQRINSLVFGGGLLYAGTAGNGVYRSNNHGMTWTVANGNALDFTLVNSMCYVNNELIVDDDNILFTTKNGGRTYNEIQGSTQQFPINHFLVIGDTILATAFGDVFHSYNGGKSWSQPVPVESQPLISFAGLAVSGNKIFAANQNGMYVSYNFGKTWSHVVATGLRPGSRNCNAFILSGNNFLLGFDEIGVYLSANSGHSWAPAINGFSATSNIDNCLIAVGDTIWSGTHSDGVYRTSDQGSNWIKTGTKNNTDTLSNAIIFSMLRPRPGVILAGTCGNGLYRSINNGGTWTHITNGLPYTANDNYECDLSLTKSGSNTIVGTSVGIYYSTDNGFSWHASNFAGDRKIANAVCANGNVVIAGVGEEVSPFQSGIYRSTDNGKTWIFEQNVLDVESIATDHAGNFYAGTLEDDWRSVNNGISFSQITAGIPAGIGGFTIQVIGNDVFIGNNDGIFFSDDQGATFTNASTGLPSGAAVQGLADDGSFLYAGLFQDAIWKRSLSEFDESFTTNKTVNLRTNKNDLSVYPNPSQGKLMMNIQMNLGGEAELSILNITGRQVLQWKEKFQPGFNSGSLNLESLPNGIYFLKVISEGGDEVVKLIIQH